jgi:DNA-binding SARP family transcriptional activator
VPLEALTEALWGSAPPLSARASLQNVVLRLRKSMAGAGASRISVRPGGYQVRVEPDELDIDRFAALLASAREARRAGSHEEAAGRLRAALSLWRGHALAGVPSDMLALREAPRLEEMRLQALEARIDSDLRLGRQADVILELRQLSGENPLRERLHALLMIALYQNGQQAEALAAYQRARSVLSDELGIEPGSELRQVQQQILAGHLVLEPGQSDGATSASPGSARQAPEPQDTAVPRQLPAAPPHFCGRAAELAALGRWADQVAEGTVVISAIVGTAGVGKTSLAVHWAHQVADRFPDGQLYVNLQGFGPSGARVTPAEAIRLFLDGLGVAPRRIPVSLDAQASLYRSLLTGKQMMIVLDNATDPAQVRPLVPGNPGCLVLVTSRNQLTGLAAAEGANLLTLDVLSERDAREMLAVRLAPGRVVATPAAVTELTELCARLPLALSIAAARAAARPGLPLAALVAELRDTRARLDALGTGDAATDMRTVLSWSCQQLSAPTARMFRLLGLHPGPDITVAAAASLAGIPRSQARRAIADLVGAHLIAEHLPGRFAFHDLLRAYSAERANSHDSEAGRRAALHRVLDHYLHTTFAATLLLCFRHPIKLSALEPRAAPEELADRRQAVAWFRAERMVLLAMAKQARASGFSVHAWQLPWTLATFLDQFGYWPELAATQMAALAAAEQLGDHAGQAEAHRYLARGRVRLGEDAEAIAHLTAAIELSARVGDNVMEALARHDLGGVYEGQGRFHDALDQADRAMRLYREVGHRWGEAMALSALGWSHSQLGSYHDALDLCRQALAIFREIDVKLGQSATLDSLGYVHHQLGQHAKAIACYTEAISIEGDSDDRRVRAEILIHLGDSHHEMGSHDQARRAWREALAIFEELHQPGTDRVRTRLGQDDLTDSTQGTPERTASAASPVLPR